MPVKLETENVQESEASAELIRELMADDAKRGNWLILMHDDDEEAFMQIAFDDHPDGINLEYRDGAHIRCRLEILSEDRACHRYGNGGLGTRICVLVTPDDYEKARKLAL